MLRLAQQKEREGGRHTWTMRSSPAKGWAKTGKMVPPLAESAPPGKEECRESERRERIKKQREEMNG